MRDVDAIIAAVKQRFPSAKIEQLKVAHPGADDDGIWYFSLPGSNDDIQIESWNGMCPFIIKTRRSPEARTGRSIKEVTDIICEHLATVSFD